MPYHVPARSASPSRRCTRPTQRSWRNRCAL